MNSLRSLISLFTSMPCMRAPFSRVSKLTAKQLPQLICRASKNFLVSGQVWRISLIRVSFWIFIGPYLACHSTLAMLAFPNFHYNAINLRKFQMSKKCDVCDKGPMFGNNVSHAKNSTKRRWNPNLRKMRAVIKGSIKTIKVCTRCLKAGKVTLAVQLRY